MIIQDRDGSLIREPSSRPHYQNQDQRRSYYAQVPAHLLDEQSSVIERIISFAFDTLGVRRLVMHIRDTE